VEITLISDTLRIVYMEYAGRGRWALRFSTVLIAFVASCFFTAVLFISNEPETLRGKIMLCAAVPAAVGCVGIFGERLIRGFNVNYIAVGDFSPFNLSNCYVVIGLITLVVYALFLDRFLVKKELPVDNRERY
jgi:lipoprotein signal peptidase